jgi:hypothetical protein
MSMNVILARALTDVTATAMHPLGSLFFDFATGKAYRYVEGDAALINDALAANEALTWMDDGWEVTNDMSVGLGVVAPAGVAISAIGEGEFGWIQVGGKATINTDGGVSAGEALVIHSVDGEVDTMAAGEEHQVFAVATADDSGTAVNLVVRVI